MSEPVAGIALHVVPTQHDDGRTLWRVTLLVEGRPVHSVGGLGIAHVPTAVWSAVAVGLRELSDMAAGAFLQTVAESFHARAQRAKQRGESAPLTARHPTRRK